MMPSCKSSGLKLQKNTHQRQPFYSNYAGQPVLATNSRLLQLGTGIFCWRSTVLLSACPHWWQWPHSD